MDLVFQEIFVHVSESLANLVYVVRIGRHAQLHALLRELHRYLWGNERDIVSLLASGSVYLQYE